MNHAGIKIEIQPSQMLAKDFDLLACRVEHAFDRIGSNLPTDSLHRDWRERVRDHNVTHQGESFVANDDVPVRRLIADVPRD
jgi:hypothetical protein